MAPSLIIYRHSGGTIVLPASPMIDRRDGGHLVVEPPREVWERAELSAGELTQWSCLVAAAGSAMLESLPALRGGCINYWEAGNWSLNAAAAPAGPKDPRRFRRVHLHLLGRSPGAQDADWEWGEAPRFPRYADREAWMAGRAPLDPSECIRIIHRAASLLATRYGLPSPAESVCSVCGYPIPVEGDETAHPSCRPRHQRV